MFCGVITCKLACRFGVPVGEGKNSGLWLGKQKARKGLENMERLVENFVRALIVEGRWTHKQVSNLLKKYPDRRGLSEVSVRRYCEVRHIHKTSRLTDDQLDVVVNNALCQVKY